MKDIRYALRRLRREPGFAVAAVLTLAIAIGACTAMFSIVQAVLLRPTGVDDPGRVVMMWPTHQGTIGEFAYNAHRDMRARMSSFDHVAVVGSTNWSGHLSIDGGEPATVPMAAVSGAFFDALGARPLLGRTFTETDDQVTAPRTIVLSHGLWVRRFGGDPAALNKRVKLDADTFEIVGVMPPEFFFPRGAEYWTPAAPLLAQYVRKSGDNVDGTLSGLGVFYGVGRLKDGQSMTSAKAETATFLAGLGTDRGLLTNAEIALTPLLSHVFGSARPALVALMAAVAIVLLIACTNVAGLLVARGAARMREMAVRAALGASARALTAQLLTESALLSVGGALLGVSAAALGLQGLIALSPADIPRLDATSLDGRVLAFAIAITAFATLVLGLIPAWRLSRPSLAGELKGSGTGTAGRSDRTGTRRMLVALQVAATLVLLTATALSIRSFARLSQIDLGFDSTNVLTFGIAGPDNGRFPTRAERDDLVDRLIEGFERDSRVVAAGALSQRPFANGPIGWDTRALLEGQVESPEVMARNPVLNYEGATPDSFAAMGIRLIRGRVFDARDRADAPLVAIVSEATAARLWPGQDPIGKRLRESYTASAAKGRTIPWSTVVGVVATARYREIESPRLDIYVPFRQSNPEVQHFMVRTSAPPLTVVSSMAAAVTALDDTAKLDGVTTMEAVVKKTRGPWQFNMLVFSMFGGVALALSAIGLFGLVAYAVNQRTREIGIRMALGANRGNVVGLMVRQGILPTTVGLVVGLAASLFATRAIESLLFETSVTDPFAFASVALLLTAVTLLACYLPARRAASVDPLLVLKD